MKGQVQIAAVADLGGLGDKEGARVTYDWVPASILRQFGPWIGVLMLLMLPGNRRLEAWWVVVPLALAWVAAITAQNSPYFIGSEIMEGPMTVLTPLLFGVGAFWLLGGYLTNLARGVVFLIGSLVIGLVGLVVFFLRGDLSDFPEAFGYIAIQQVGGFLIALGLTLASLVCHRLYSPARFTLWFGLVVFGGWLVVSLSVSVLFLIIVSSGDWAGVIPSTIVWVIGLGASTFGAALPFLLLSFFEPFYRGRLMALYRLGQFGRVAEEPPVITPPATSSQ